MKKRTLSSFYTFIFFVFPLSADSAKESLDQISLQGEALWEARDFGEAEALYKNLLTHPLPEWQHARLQYNLGTIRLAQHKTNEAIDLFQQILPSQLALPRFSRNLFLNEGIAYYQFEQTAAPNTPFYDLQELYLQQGLRAVETAERVGCQLQQSEQEIKESACSPQELIEGWKKTILFQMDEIHQKQAQKWMKKASIESLATFMSVALQQLINEAKALQDQHQPPSALGPWGAYFQHQTESLAPLWEALKQKKFTPAQLDFFNGAAADYQNAMKNFTHKELSLPLKSLSSSLEKLKPLCFKEGIALRLAHLNYEILLTQPFPAAGDIQSMLWEINQLKDAKEHASVLEQIKQNLQTGLENFEKNDILTSQFFLLAGFSQLDSLLPAKNLTPLAALQQALDQANRSFKLFLLAQLIPPGSSKDKNLLGVVKGNQQNVLARAHLFIPAVLKEQNALFHDSDSPASGCQQSPWDQVIPLFDHGFLAAQSADKSLSIPSSIPQLIAAQQEQTLQDWQEALNLLMNPPNQSQQNRTGGASSSTPKNLAETFRLIQEMYLEDQSQPEPARGEMHSW